MKLRTLCIAAMLCGPTSGALAQMGGGPGGGDNAPAFNEPKFSDRLYEAGGPRAKQATNGSIIYSVVIEGNRSVSESAIISNMQSRVDRFFDEDTLHRDVNALHRTHLFKSIKPYYTEDERGVHIKLVVDERPLVGAVYFTGNQRIEDSALKKQTGLEKGDALDPIRINSARSRLIDYYRDNGMNNVDIQIISGLMPGQRDIEFLINEGTVERLKTISFRGNQDFSSELLRAKISCRTARFIIGSYLPRYNLASDIKIEQDRQTLTAYYRSLGYFDARVDYRKEYDDAGKWVDLTFIISEGARYTVRNISIVGTQRYTSNEILPYLTCKSGDYFKQTNKGTDERFIYDLYGTQGHYFCDVVGELVYQPDNQVDIIYNVAEGDIYRISEIRVHLEGEFTKEPVVLHPLGNVRPGSIINSKEISNAARRLQYSSIFNTDPSQGIVPTIKVEPPENMDF